MHYTDKSLKLNEVKYVNFYSPIYLKQSLENLFKEQGDFIIYKPDFYKNEKCQDLLVNLLFYFNLLQLPYSPLILFTHNNDFLNETANNMKMVFTQAKEGKRTSIYRISTIERIDTCNYNNMMKNQTMNKQDTLMSKISISKFRCMRYDEEANVKKT